MSAENAVSDIMITQWQLFAKSDMLAGGRLCVNQLIGNAFWLPAQIWFAHATGGGRFVAEGVSIGFGFLCERKGGSFLPF